MQVYSETQLAMLEALARFQYLTPSQFVMLGMFKIRKSAYPPLARLANEHKPAVAKINFTVSPTQGRPEAVHYLTFHGVKRLVEAGYEKEDIKYPRRGAVSFASDYKHRKWTVDFFIHLENWAKSKDYNLSDFYYYFQQSGGSNRNNKGGVSLSDNRIDIGKNDVEYIIPDGVAIVERAENKPFFLLFEQHNGKDTKRFLRQVHAHTLAISEGLPSLKYEVTHEGQYVANRVFCVFEFESCMKASMHRLATSEQFRHFMPFFCFRANESLEDGVFDDGWRLANGQEAVIQ